MANTVLIGRLIEGVAVMKCIFNFLCVLTLLVTTQNVLAQDVSPIGTAAYCNSDLDVNTYAATMEEYSFITGPLQSPTQADIFDRDYSLSFAFRLYKCIRISETSGHRKYEWQQVEDTNPIDIAGGPIGYAFVNVRCDGPNKCHSNESDTNAIFHGFKVTREPNPYSIPNSPFTENVRLTLPLGDLLTGWERGQFLKNGQIDKTFEVYAFDGRPATLGWRFDITLQRANGTQVSTELKDTSPSTFHP